MRTQSGNTLLIAIAVDGNSTPDKMLSRLRSIIPVYLQGYFAEHLETHTSGNHAVVTLTDYKHSREILAGVIADWLQMVCMQEKCNAYDERFLIQIVDELKPRKLDLSVVRLLKEKIQRHVALANQKFGQNALFHRQSNIEVGFNVGNN